MSEKRYALVSLRSATNGVQTIALYMPGNYEVIGEVELDRETVNQVGPPVLPGRYAVIAGQDSHGWTFEDYVKPRLLSGLHVTFEIDPSHPALKRMGR